MKPFILRLAVVSLLLLASATPSFCDIPLDDPIIVLGRILSTPEDQIDFATAILTVEKAVDPSVDIQANELAINQAVQTIQKMARPNATSMGKFIATRGYMFDKGRWNHHQIYEYDLDHAHGEDMKTAFASNLINTKLGNCVSLPSLFVILAQRVGLDVALINAPHHIMASFTEPETGKEYKLEVTTGAYPVEDDKIIEHQYISPLAIQNGIYLNHLTKKQSVATVAMGIMGEYFYQTGQPQKILELSDLILKYHPMMLDPILNQRGAYIMLRDAIYDNRSFWWGPYSTDQLSPEALHQAQIFDKAADDCLRKATNLGWHPMGQEERNAYEQAISDEWNLRKQN